MGDRNLTATEIVESIPAASSDTDHAEDAGRGCAAIAFRWLCAAIFFGFFGAVYEQFSHNVYSNWMLYACAFPLILGTLPFLWMSLGGRRMPGTWAQNFWHAGILVLTVGSIMQGVLEIYGTTNRLILGYWIAGGILLAAGLILYIKDLLPVRQQKKTSDIPSDAV